MRIIFTTHAKQRMVEREISLDLIMDALEIPDYTVSSEQKIGAYKKINNRILKVVYEKKDNYIKVVTLMWK